MKPRTAPIAPFFPDLARLLRDGRPAETRVAYGADGPVTWRDFAALIDAAAEQTPGGRHLLAEADPLRFAAALLAARRKGSTPVIPPNFQPGTQTDTEDQIAGRPYGIGTLYAPVAGGAIQIQVACEHNGQYASLQPMRVGDVLRVSDRPSTGGAGNEEWVSVTGVSYGADFATVDISPALANSYATATTLVSSVLELPSVIAAWSGLALTSMGGSFDAATVGNLVAHNKGAIEENWTLTFSSATTFTVSGNVVGTLASPGSVSADYAPLNPATGTPYFTVKAIGWGGTFQANDTVSIATQPAAIPIWYRRQVPAGTFSLANDYTSLAIHGESA